MTLVRGLPKESLTSLVDDDGALWSVEAELMATAVEQIDRLTRQTIAFNVKKGKRLPDPIRIVRPGRSAPSRRDASPDDVRAIGGAVEYVEVA